MAEETNEVNFSIEAFDPTESKLNELVQETAHIVEVNLDDPEQLAIVKRGRLNLRSARVSLEKTGKAMRDGANAFSKKVIARENELVAIIEVEEKRLADFEKKAAELAEHRLRISLLPERKARLEQIGITLEDDVINTMTSLQFETNINQLVAEKNEADRLENERIQKERQAELDAKEAEIKKKEQDLENDRLAKEREEKVRQDERDRIDREAKEKQEREQREEDERKKKEDESIVRRERAEKYRAFRTGHGWTEETKGDFYEQATDEKVILYKKVGEFDLPQVNL